MASITYSMLYNCSHQEFGQDPKTSDQVWTAKMEVDVENYYITYGNDHC